MATKKVKKYEGGGLLHENIPGMYNITEARWNPKAKEDVEAIPVPEPRRMEPKEEVDVLGEFINKLQSEKPSRAAPRATPRTAPAPRRPTVDRADVDTALAEAAAQAQIDYDNPSRRRATPPYVYGGPSPVSDLRDLARAPANRRAAKRAAEALGNSAFKKGGSVKSGASKRADGCAVRGKTKGRMI